MGKHEIMLTIKTKYAVYKLEKIPCGKIDCGKCPHGPYWYGYYNVPGRPKKRHVGKTKKSIRVYIGRRFKLLHNDPGEIVDAPEGVILI